MKLKRIPFYTCIVLCLVAVFSCKKDEETEYNYIEGEYKIAVPEYYAAGTSLDLVSTAELLEMVSNPEGLEMGLTYKVTPGMSTSDTVYFASKNIDKGRVIVQFPDTLCTVTLTISAFDPTSKYYAASKTASIVLVDTSMPSKSITYNDADKSVSWPLASDKKFTDSRDGKQYVVCKVGNTEWMKQNLAWEGAGLAWAESDVLTNVFGRYYSYEEALTACPEGWRLPTENDWTALASAISGESGNAGETLYGAASGMIAKTWFNKNALWSYAKGFDLSEESLISASLFGYAVLGVQPSFTGRGEYAVFWTDGPAADLLAPTRYCVQGYGDLYYGERDRRSFGASVRCVR